jgi:starch synthase
MRILSVTSEVYPLVKTGGLADVAGALPPALGRRGIAMRTLVPGYPSVTGRVGAARVLHAWNALLGTPARLLAATVEGLELIVLDAPALFDRPGGPYAGPDGRDHPDNWRRFAALSRAGAEVAGGAVPEFRPDLVQAHDWQAAMTPAYMRYMGVPRPSVVTVHNLAFQGQFPAGVFGGLELPPQAFALDGVEYYGGVGFLKAGIANATAITTVSPTYAQEITTPAQGMGLDGLIRARAGVLHGIANGIDVEVWNPETDPHLAATYSARAPKGRIANRRAVETRFGLDPDQDALFVVVSRLTWQKGIDLLAAVADGLVAEGAKLAVLGTGEGDLEAAFLSLAGRHRGRVGAVIGYDEALAHRMQGGGDAIVIPSRFEPCGLTQLCGLRYGCVPVVARVGGLADTVIDANLAALQAGVATGFQFAPVDGGGLASALLRAIRLHRTPKAWASVQRQGMKADVSWDHSAAQYADLFASLAPAAQGSPA